MRSFGYTIDISKNATFTVDTRQTGIASIHFSNLNLTYLQPSGELTVGFQSNFFDGTSLRVGRDVSFNNSAITLSDTSYNVIGSTWKGIVQVTSAIQSTDNSLYFKFNSTTTPSVVNSINIDTRLRSLIDISMSPAKLTYLNPSGEIKFTFNYKMLDTDENLKSFINSNPLTISNPKYLDSSNITLSCIITASADISQNVDVSMNRYNSSTKSLRLNVDTRQRRATAITVSNNIFYNQLNSPIQLKFDYPVLESNLSNATFDLSGIGTVSGFSTSDSGTTWNGNLQINSTYDLSLNSYKIAVTYQGVRSEFDISKNINTIRPQIFDISMNTANRVGSIPVLTYIEPSCNMVITFDRSVLDNSINSYLDASFVTLGIFSPDPTRKVWTGRVTAPPETDISDRTAKVVFDRFYARPSIDFSFNVMTKKPSVTYISLTPPNLDYINLTSNITIQFTNPLYDSCLNDIFKKFTIANVLDATKLTFNLSPDVSINKSWSGTISFARGIKIDAAAEIFFQYTTDSGKSGSVNFYIDTVLPKPTITIPALSYHNPSGTVSISFDKQLLPDDLFIKNNPNSMISFTTSAFPGDVSLSSFTYNSTNNEATATLSAKPGMQRVTGNDITINYCPTSDITSNLTSIYFDLNMSNNPFSNICFPAGEMVFTDAGYKPIERIRPGVDTVKGLKIVELTETVSKEKTMTLITHHSLGPNIPYKDTLVSNNHKIQWNQQMVCAKNIKADGVMQVSYRGEILYNVLLETEETMVVNGMVVETLSPHNNVAKLYRLLARSEKYKDRIISLFNANNHNCSPKENY